MTVTYLDFSNYLSTVEAICKDIYQYDGTGVSATAFGYFRETANRIRGFYFDLFGGSGNFSPFQQSPSLDPNGSNGNWEANKAALAAYIRTQLRTLDASIYTSTENCEEGLIGSIDIHHIGQIGESGGTAPFGQLGWLFATVYSRYQCMFDLAVSLNTTATALSPIPSTQAVYYATWVNAAFHYTGGHLCLNNFTANVLVPTAGPTLGNCPMFYTLSLIKDIITKMNATPVIRTYMHTGYRMRPLAASWEGDYIASGHPLASYLANEQGSGTPGIYVSSSVWLNPTADANYASTSNCLGIVITSASTANFTYAIAFDAEEYELDPTRPYALYQRSGTTRTELTRFVGTCDYDLSVTWDGATAPVILLEVAAL